MIRTDICRMLRLDCPIFQGGMAWIADARLAAAVSNAGGLGIISAINTDAEAVREEIRLCRRLTDRTFGVNIMLMADNVPEVAAIVAEERVPVVTTGAGLPTPYMKSWLEAGIKVIPVVGSCAIAIRAERMGACAVIAEGGESGGHIGEMNTIALVPQVCDAVSIPVIAAGGIADGRGLAAALMLGAQGIQCGTCFLVADECRISEVYKEKILKAHDSDTIVTGKFLGHPVRALKSPFTRKYAEMERKAVISNQEALAFGTGSLRRAVEDGDLQTGSFMAGQSAGLVARRGSAKDIIDDILKGADQTIRTFTK